MRNEHDVTAFVAALSLMLAGAVAAPRLVAWTAESRSPTPRRRDTDGVRTLLKGGADVNAAQGDGMTALHRAALNGDLKTMDVLLYAGATTESLTRVGGCTPLHLASSRGHAGAVTRLLTAGSKPAR